jgi:hypothetical protein
MNRFQATLLSLVIIALVTVPYFANNQFWLINVPLWVLLQSPVVLVPLAIKPSSSSIIGLAIGISIFFVTASMLPTLHGKGSSVLYVLTIPGAVFGGFLATRWLRRLQAVNPLLKAAIAAIGVLVGASAFLSVISFW